jgi:AraC-like DNA-binding protein
LIQDANDLRHLIAYVHLNPVSAGLVTDPADHELSGHREVTGRCRPILIDVASTLHCFEEETAELARFSYLTHMRCVFAAKWAHRCVRELPWWQEVADDYQTVTLTDAPRGVRTFDDKHPNLPLPASEPIEELLDRVCECLGTEVSDLAGRGKRSASAHARRQFTFVASRHFGHSLKTISEVLNKSPSQVSRWLKRETEDYCTDPNEVDFMDGIACRLLGNR